MNTIVIKSEKQLKAFVNQNRENITNINGVEFKSIYPILTVTNKNASYYDVESQGSKFLTAPFKVQVNS